MEKKGGEIMAEDTLYTVKNKGDHFGCSNHSAGFESSPDLFAYIKCNDSDGTMHECANYTVLDKNKKKSGTVCCSIDLSVLTKVSSANNAMTMARNFLTDIQKRNLSKNAQALVEAGFYTTDLRLMSDSHFVQFLADKFESDYAQKAQAELDADDAVKKQAQMAAEAAMRVKK